MDGNVAMNADTAALAQIKRIGVIGAGQMGNGIAHVAALAGFDVKLVDSNPAQLAKARDTIAGHMQRQVKRGKLAEPAMREGLARIETGLLQCHADLATRSIGLGGDVDPGDLLHAPLQAALAAITAAVVGVIANLALWFAVHVQRWESSSRWPGRWRPTNWRRRWRRERWWKRTRRR